MSNTKIHRNLIARKATRVLKVIRRKDVEENKALKLIFLLFMNKLSEYETKQLLCELSLERLNLKELLIRETKKPIRPLLIPSYKFSHKKSSFAPKCISYDQIRNIDLITYIFSNIEGFIEFQYTRHLTHDDMKNIARYIKYEFYQKGTYIYRKGDNSNKFYGIIEGKINLFESKYVDKLKQYRNYRFKFEAQNVADESAILFMNNDNNVDDIITLDNFVSDLNDNYNENEISENDLNNSIDYSQKEKSTKILPLFNDNERDHQYNFNFGESFSIKRWESCHFDPTKFLNLIKSNGEIKNEKNGNKKKIVNIIIEDDLNESKPKNKIRSKTKSKSCRKTSNKNIGKISEENKNLKTNNILTNNNNKKSILKNSNNNNNDTKDIHTTLNDNIANDNNKNPNNTNNNNTNNNTANENNTNDNKKNYNSNKLLNKKSSKLPLRHCPNSLDPKKFKLTKLKKMNEENPLDELTEEEKKNVSELNAGLLTLKKELSDGNVLGDRDLYKKTNRSYSAYCQTDTHLFSLQKDIFDKYILEKMIRSEIQKKNFIVDKLSIIKKDQHFFSLVSNINPLLYKKGQIIFTPFDKANYLYLVYQGECAICESEKIYTDKKEYLLDKPEMKIISILNEGGIGGLEGYQRDVNYENYMIVNAPMTVVLKLDITDFDDDRNKFRKSLEPLYFQQQRMLFSVKRKGILFQMGREINKFNEERLMLKNEIKNKNSSSKKNKSNNKVVAKIETNYKEMLTAQNSYKNIYNNSSKNKSSNKNNKKINISTNNINHTKNELYSRQNFPMIISDDINNNNVLKFTSIKLKKNTFRTPIESKVYSPIKELLIQKEIKIKHAMNVMKSYVIPPRNNSIDKIKKMLFSNNKLNTITFSNKNLYKKNLTIDNDSRNKKKFPILSLKNQHICKKL